MGVGPIPRSKAKGYASEHGIDQGDGFDRFWAIIHAVDNEYLSQVNSSKTDKTKNTVSADDTEGVRGMFRDIHERKKKQAKDK